MGLSGRAAAEAVQVSPTVDANTTALYRFKEGVGTTTACEVAGVPAGTFNSAIWVPGRQYYAAATGPGYVTIADNAALRPQNAITVEVWVKLQQSAGDLVCKNTVYLFRLGTTVSAYFYVGGAWRSFSGHLPVPTGQWAHLAITYDSATQTAAIYVNGVLDTAQQFTGLSSYTLNQGTYTVYIGQDDWNPSGSHVTGKVDVLRISNIARAFDPLYPPVTPPPTPAGNLVPNGNFESGLVGWRGDGEGDVNLVWETTGGAASGLLCLHSLPAGRTDYSSLPLPGSPLGLYSRPISAYAGRSYTLSLRMKSSVTMSPRITVETCGAGSFSTLSPFPIYPTVNTNWTQITQSFTLPGNFSATYVCVHFQYPSSGELWVDDVRLVGGSSPTSPLLQDMIAVGPQSLPIGNVYFAGTPTPITLNIVNTDAVDHSVTVQASVVDWQGSSFPRCWWAQSQCLPAASKRPFIRSTPAAEGPSGSASTLPRRVNPGTNSLR